MTQTSLFNNDRIENAKPAAPKFKRTTRSSSNTKFVKGEGWVTCLVKAQAMWDEGRHTVTDGIVRWSSNNSVPPLDILEDWAELGLPFDLEASKAASDAEFAEFAARYRAQQKAPSSEHLAEMRNEFGPGTTVVDVISGRRIRL